MTLVKPTSFMKSQLSKTKMPQTIDHPELQQPSLLSRIDMNNTSSLSLPNQIDTPLQQRTLLSRIDLGTTPLLDRVQCPAEIEAQPLHMRILTLSSRTVNEGELQNHQLPKRCLSPWNGSPTSRPIPERRCLSPTLPKSILSSENQPKTLSLFERMTQTPERTTKRKITQESEPNLPYKKRQTALRSSTSFPKDQQRKETLTTDAFQNLSDNDWHSQICLGIDQREQKNLSTNLSVATEPVSSLKCTEKTLHEASFSSALPTTLQKESRPPNGSGFFEGSHSTSTISSLQSSTLKSMRTGRLALERHISLLARAKPRERSETLQTGQQHGVEHPKPSLSLSPIAGKSSTSTKDTFKSNLTQNSHTLTQGSYPTTLQSEIMLGEDKQHCSPTRTSSPTYIIYIQPLSYQMESSSHPHLPTYEDRHLQKRQKAQKSVTNSTLTQDVLTTLVNTDTCAKSVGETTHRTSATIHTRSEEGLQPKYRRYNL